MKHQNDLKDMHYLNLLDVKAYAEIGISPFQMALQDSQALLPQIVRFHVPPFESLVVTMVMSFFGDYLHEQEFALLLVNVLLHIM